VKVRYRGLMKNTAQLQTLFALSNPWWPVTDFCRGRRDECVCSTPIGPHELWNR
jgi:hypothetical protein